MKKIVILSSVIVIIAVFVYLNLNNNNQATEQIDSTQNITEKPDTTVQEKSSYMYESKNFTLTFPGEFAFESSQDGGRFRPKNTGEFPQINFYQVNSEALQTPEDILEDAKLRLKNLCNQTDACGEIISSKETQISDLTSLQYVVQYKGRSIDDSEGFVNEYHFAIPFYGLIDDELNQMYLLNIWTSASDLEDPSKIMSQFEKIADNLEINN